MRDRRLLPGILSIFLLAAPAKAGQLQFWRFDSSQNRLEFITDEGIQPQAQVISDPVRLVIDLPGTVLRRLSLTRPVGGAIRTIRVGQFDRQTTRLVIEFAPGYTIDPQQVRFRGVTANQWSVQIPQAISITNPTPPSQRPELGRPPITLGTASSVPAQTPVRVPPQISSPPPLSVPRRSNARYVVVLDPGHGGPDPGAVGIGGLQEKGVVLEISQQVAVLLEQQGIRAILTRPDDRDLDLEPRV